MLLWKTAWSYDRMDEDLRINSLILRALITKPRASWTEAASPYWISEARFRSQLRLI